MKDRRPARPTTAAADLGVDVVATLPEALTPYLGHVLNRVHAQSVVQGTTILRAGRHPSEMAVLTAVEDGGATSQRVLGDRLGINRTVMVQILDRLEAEGLVRRCRDRRDRRSHAVELTDAGRRITAALDAAAQAHTAAVTRRLTDGSRRRLHALLHELLSRAPNGLPDLPPKLRERTGFLVARSLFVVRAAERDALAPLGLEPRHFAALAVLDGIEPCAQQNLADALGVSDTIVVQLADRLEELAVVERRLAAGDRRVRLLAVTPHGRETLRAAKRLVRRADDLLTAPLGRGGAAKLRQLLGQLL
jgi:DNA-binding MarR family transcriptional regulator